MRSELFSFSSLEGFLLVRGCIWDASTSPDMCPASRCDTGCGHAGCLGQQVPRVRVRTQTHPKAQELRLAANLTPKLKLKA